VSLGHVKERFDVREPLERVELVVEIDMEGVAAPVRFRSEGPLVDPPRASSSRTEPSSVAS
jgi:hypothetical protein